jgi:hypothetical protein
VLLGNLSAVLCIYKLFVHVIGGRMGGRGRQEKLVLSEVIQVKVTN